MKDKSMQPIAGPCWGWGRGVIDAYDMFATEIMHVLDLGVVRTLILHISRLPCASEVQRRLDSFPR
jgi:hypothetical protein